MIETPWYAGAGARRTPSRFLELMSDLATALARLGWGVRSGGARGADQAFLAAARAAGGRVELYLPWPDYEGLTGARLERPTAAAYELAARHHPAWAKLGRGPRALHARNAHEVLGAELDTPVRVFVCWTPDGSLTGRGRGSGGTGQAIRIATAAAVPVINLARPDHLARAEAFLHRIAPPR